MANTPKTKIAEDYKISKDSVEKIRSYLQIQLNECWILKRESLSQAGEEDLRNIGRSAGFIEELLPGGAK